MALQLLDAGWSILRVPDLRVYHDTQFKHHHTKAVNSAHIRNTALLAYLRYPWRKFSFGYTSSAESRRLRGTCGTIPRNRRRTTNYSGGSLALPQVAAARAPCDDSASRSLSRSTLRFPGTSPKSVNEGATTAGSSNFTAADITVIIPTWRRHESLQRAISETLNCRPAPAEVLVHVDPGDDETERSLKPRFPQGVRWFSQRCHARAGRRTKPARPRSQDAASGHV